MDSEIILEILKYALNTRIPYRWDFCRFPLERNVRLCVNTGSYFLGYAAFVFWFTNSVLRELKSLAGERLSHRYRCLALTLSLCTATQILWPALLISTYFFACSFYPWLSTVIILLLNTRRSISSLIPVGLNKSKELFQTLLPRSKVQSDSSVISIDYSTFPDNSEEWLRIASKKGHSDTGLSVKKSKITHSTPLGNSWEATYVSGENVQARDGSASEIQPQDANKNLSHTQEKSIEDLLIDRNMMIINNDSDVRGESYDEETAMRFLKEAINVFVELQP